MEQQRVLIECKPATIRQMKDDPTFLVQHVEGYMVNNLGAGESRASTSNNDIPDNTQNDSQRLKELLKEIKEMKRNLKKLKVKQVRFVDEEEQYELNKSLLNILKRIEKLTDKMKAAADVNQKELVVVVYEETEWITKMRNWHNEAV